MNILLTGATGFIGRKTTSVLEKQNYKVFPFRGDVRLISDWEKNLREDIDIVIHLASVRTETVRDFEVNTKGTESLFKAVRNLKKIPGKIIIASSQAVYIGCKPPFTEDMTVSPKTVYGRSKYEAEKVGLGNSRNINIVILRYSTVIGPGIREKSNMSGPLYRWIQSALEGKDIIVFQDGKQTRDYIHVDDVASANLLAVEKDIKGIFNVGGGRKIQLKDLASLVKKTANSESRIVINGVFSKNDPHDLYSDISKLKSLGWEPKNKIEKAVYEAVHFMRK